MIHCNYEYNSETVSVALRILHKLKKKDKVVHKWMNSLKNSKIVFKQWVIFTVALKHLFIIS